MRSEHSNRTPGPFHPRTVGLNTFAFFRRYKTILPMVKQQVESQIKVRDMSSAKVSIEPADYTSWSDVRTELIAEAKVSLRSELETELAAATEGTDISELRRSFLVRERSIEHKVDSTVHNFSATIDVTYKCAFFTTTAIPPHNLIFSHTHTHTHGSFLAK